ncbi:MAG TPA: methyltransferase domain-containing protein [Hanamia sp.]
MNNDESSFPKKGNHFHRYLQYASAVLNNYNGKEPFHLYLKKYFSANKKHGSRDRKFITALCYYYFRLGFGVKSTISIEEKLILAIFLIEKEPSATLESFKPEWNQRIHLSIDQKLEIIQDVFNAEKIFPFRHELSDQITFRKFSLSFLIQPKLFIRIRPGYQTSVFDKLKSANNSFERKSETCLTFTNNEKLDDILKIDKEAVIQDYNSQKTVSLLALSFQPSALSISIWDCCAASGGKSILAYDLLKNIELTASDSRKNVLENLKKRFEKAGIKKYHSFVADLSTSRPVKDIEGNLFDVIIADVPCSGSGTWSRTPEQIHFFKKESISAYSSLQRKIVTNVAKSLTENGQLLYITCSVFKEENEENVNYIQKELNLQLTQSKYLNGYEMQADTLFVALFTTSKK